MSVVLHLLTLVLGGFLFSGDLSNSEQPFTAGAGLLPARQDASA